MTDIDRSDYQTGVYINKCFSLRCPHNFYTKYSFTKHLKHLKSRFGMIIDYENKEVLVDEFDNDSDIPENYIKIGDKVNSEEVLIVLKHFLQFKDEKPENSKIQSALHKTRHSKNSKYSELYFDEYIMLLKKSDETDMVNKVDPFMSNGDIEKLARTISDTIFNDERVFVKDWKEELYGYLSHYRMVKQEAHFETYIKNVDLEDIGLEEGDSQLKIKKVLKMIIRKFEKKYDSNLIRRYKSNDDSLFRILRERFYEKWPSKNEWPFPF
jgi:hypothetical protein